MAEVVGILLGRGRPLRAEDFIYLVACVDFISQNSPDKPLIWKFLFEMDLFPKVSDEMLEMASKIKEESRRAYTIEVLNKVKESSVIVLSQ